MMVNTDLKDTDYNDFTEDLIKTQPAESTSILIDETSMVVEGRWKDNTYDCFNDVPTCLMGWCCPWIQIAQTYEKVLGPRKMCVSILGTFLLFYFLLLSTSNFYNKTGYTFYLYTYRTMAFLSNLYVLVLLTTIRKGIRNYYNIPETTCKGCEDICCSFWCPVCSSCQNARHIYNNTPEGGRGGCNCTSTGDPSPNEQIWLQEPYPISISAYGPGTPFT